MVDTELDSTQPLLLTTEGHKRLQDELSHLTKVKRAEIAERIRESKDHGEFSEDNNELEVVKMEQSLVETRISELKAIFADAEVLPDDEIPDDHVGLGSWVKVTDDYGDSFEVRIVSSVESDPENDQVSDESPMGQALLGLEVGDTAEVSAPVGTLHYKILAIRNR